MVFQDGSTCTEHEELCGTVQTLMKRVADLERRLGSISEDSRLPPVSGAKRRHQS